MNNVTDIQSEKDKMEWNKIFKHFELDEIVITFTERSVARVIVALKRDLPWQVLNTTAHKLMKCAINNNTEAHFSFFKVYNKPN